MPLHRPRDRKDAAMTMTMASKRDSVNSEIESFTTFGWSATSPISIPAGRSALADSISLFKFSPRVRLFPPDRMETAMPMAGLPLK